MVIASSVILMLKETTARAWDDQLSASKQFTILRWFKPHLLLAAPPLVEQPNGFCFNHHADGSIRISDNSIPMHGLMLTSRKS
jgi:hypothetical protein